MENIDTYNAAEAIQKGFEVSPLVGFLVSSIVLLIAAVIALYKDRNKTISNNLEIAKAGLTALDKVADLKDLSKEQTREIRELRMTIVENKCGYTSQGA
jgi:hypothetical protein